ncbi:MAG: hypothetical protein JWM07_176 [Candidatus Saccharibacteria bacterium]|nr:hypothetical protein [Candidatus Saccharibacteria bacterium]
MANPFVRDIDGDGVKQLDLVRVLAAGAIALVLLVLIAGFISGPPTWISGLFGAIEGFTRFFGIFLCLPLIIFFFFYRRSLLKPKEDDDSFTYAKRKKTAGRLLIVIIVLAVYMVITYVIWIITILAVAVTG